jgi:hypothetical protein
MLAKELIIVGCSARAMSMVEGTKCREGFFGRKSIAPAPKTVALAGVVPLLRESLRLLSSH